MGRQRPDSGPRAGFPSGNAAKGLLLVSGPGCPIATVRSRLMSLCGAQSPVFFALACHMQMSRSKPDQYLIDSETKRLARYLFQMIDKRDWGYFDRDSGRPKFAHTAVELYASPRVRQSMTRQLIQAHRDGRTRVYGTSRRASGYCFAMIDVDQHDGQTDGLDLVRLLAVRYFPRCYWESSRRGYHLYVVFWCKFLARSAMNRLLVSLRDSLRTIAVAQGFNSTLDVTGSFAEPRHVNHASGEECYKHGTLFAIPNPETPEAMTRLVHAPVYLPRVIRSIEAGPGTTASPRNGRAVNRHRFPLYLYPQ